VNPRLFLSLILAAPLAAGGTFGVSLGMDQISCPEVGRVDARFLGDYPPGVYARLMDFKSVGVVLQGAYTPRPGPLALSLTGAYRPPIKDFVFADIFDRSDSSTIDDIGKFSDSYASLGLRLSYQGSLAYGVSLEMRRETLELARKAFPSTLKATLTRPWLGISLGWTIPLPWVSKPILTVAGYKALSQRTAPAPTAPLTEDTERGTLEAMAPETQALVSVGFRFGK
jgi:hypothetical protein